MRKRRMREAEEGEDEVEAEPVWSESADLLSRDGLMIGTLIERKIDR